MILFWSAVFILFSSSIAEAEPDTFVDRDNCQLCHRYPTLGRHDGSGERRSFYVNGNAYVTSLHGKFRCTECHKGLDKIPHSGTLKVDCAQTCHVENSTREFSHKNVIETYDASVHGRGTGDNEKPFPEDLPTCEYCHNNRDYYSRDKSRMSPKDDLATFRRAGGQLRTQMEVVELCTSCHGDEEKMARHGLESTQTYKGTFHWEAMKYGAVDAPDCISCHVSLGSSVHDIRAEDDPESSIYLGNRVSTCSNEGGLQSCHPGSSEGFASGRVHEYGEKAKLMNTENSAGLIGDTNAGTLKQSQGKVLDDEAFHYKVLSIIRLIYKILIGFTIGFMVFHQALDYMRARKKHKMSHGLYEG